MIAMFALQVDRSLLNQGLAKSYLQQPFAAFTAPQSLLEQADGTKASNILEEVLMADWIKSLESEHHKRVPWMNLNISINKTLRSGRIVL